MQDRSWLGDGVSAPAPLADLLDAQPTADGWVAVLAISDEEFAGLARALDKPQLVDDPRFAELQSRMEHGAEMSAAIKEVSRTLTSADFLARLEAEGVPCAPVNTSEQLIDDPQLLANGLLREIEHPHCGPMRVPGPVARFEGTPAKLHSPSPLLGEHSDQLLAELGLNEKEIAVLREQGNVA
jgi:crotonobetainyl-CoA:carnitine CoA-transferase CaiB-like acyl-CoA transferase